MNLVKFQSFKDGECVICHAQLPHDAFGHSCHACRLKIAQQVAATFNQQIDQQVAATFNQQIGVKTWEHQNRHLELLTPNTTKRITTLKRVKTYLTRLWKGVFGTR